MRPAEAYRRQAEQLWNQVERLRIDVRRRSRQNYQLREINRCLEQELRCRVALIDSLKRLLSEAADEVATERRRVPLQLGSRRLEELTWSGTMCRLMKRATMM